MTPIIQKNELYGFEVEVRGDLDAIEFYKRYAYKAHSLLLMTAEVNTKKKQKSMAIIDSCVKITFQGDFLDIASLSKNGENFITGISEILISEFNGTSTANGLRFEFKRNDDGHDEEEKLIGISPFSVIRSIIKNISSNHIEDLFIGGNFSFDLYEQFEKLPTVGLGLTSCPGFSLYISELALFIDHQSGKGKLKGSVFGHTDGAEYKNPYFDLTQKMDSLKNKITLGEFNSFNSPEVEASDVEININDDEFMGMVDKVKKKIIEGEIFQTVVSRTFSIQAPDPLNSFRKLTESNQSPYMFYMKDETFELFGASPESALKFDHVTRDVTMYPIAGTRRRAIKTNGEVDLDLDGKIEIELRANTKEVAEHMMLVDLARNDIARISEVGSRFVAPLLQVDRYQRVMHLVSQVQGKLKSHLDALHAYQAVMNMGTLTGAPKVRATSILRELEGTERGIYGGAVGYINGAGDMDTCIVIRSAFVKNKMAYVQAGAGIVYDSNPTDEVQETKDKAFSVLQALGARNI
jgi:anthranilate synthase component 1